MAKAFISYHSADQYFKEYLQGMARHFGCFTDGSVNTGDIPDDSRSSQSIRTKIRDEYLRDCDVTILLCGSGTKGRKHVDWELKSSMIDTELNRRSGLVVINLPGISPNHWVAGLPEEKSAVYPNYHGPWAAIPDRKTYERIYPYMPARIIDQLMTPGVMLSVVPWDRVANDPASLRWLVDMSAWVGRANPYNLSREMRRNNSPAVTGLGAYESVEAPQPRLSFRTSLFGNTRPTNALSIMNSDRFRQ